MRILHLAQFYAPIIGGEERHVSSISRAQAARGHDVEVATLAHPERPSVVKDGGVTVRSIAGWSQRFGALFSDDHRRHAPPFPDPGLTAAIAKIVSAFKPDIVHGHNWLVHSFLPVKASSGAALVMTLHDYGLVCARKTMMRNGAVCAGPAPARCLPCARIQYGAAVGTATYVGNSLSGWFERRTVDRFVAVSRAVAEHCGLTDGSAAYDVLPTFVPDDVATLAPPDEHIGELPTGDFILYVGDLNRNKGVGVLLDAYRTLGTAVPPLVMIGRRCADMPTDLPTNVMVRESWPHPAVMQAWSRCLFGIAPSVWPEACGTIVMEGHAVGRPMIASDIGGLSDLVAHNETGLLVPPGNAAALAQAMQALLDDPERRARMGQAARARAETFMAKAILPRIEQVYAEALRARMQGSSQLNEATP